MSGMEFNSTKMKGLFVIEPKPFRDSRGFFERIFCKEEFRRAGLEKEIVQINRSITIAQGTIRGMHYQNPPYAEVKIIKCLRGKVFDVAVDLRSTSPTFLHWHGVELSAEQGNAVYIPEGFAHGFQTLEENCELLYMHTQNYNPANEGGICFNEPKVNIHWPLPIGYVSQRDKSHPLLNEGYKGIN